MARTAVIVLVGCTGLAAGALVDFEDVAPAGNPILTTLNSGGFNFASDHFHSIDSFGTNIVQNGSSVFIGHEGGDLGRTITMTKIGGGAFDVAGFDGAELWLDAGGAYPNASQIRVTGFFQAGGSITQYLQLDGLRDGAGGVDDFESFSLVGFVGLSSMEMTGANAAGAEDFAFTVDNIDTQLRVVPLPTGAALGMAGLLGLGCIRRRKA